MQTLPEIVTLSVESTTRYAYDNHAVASVNDHVVRISVMTEPYRWHLHPDSDETFLVIEGRIAIDFETGSVELGPGQMATVPRGRRHNTRPLGSRSVNLTIEAANMTTRFDAESGAGHSS